MAACDVAIIGGGPAGSVAAILLARCGAKVVLVDASAGRERIEGLSPRVLEILVAHGLETAGVDAALPRATAWGENLTTLNHEHPVLRPAFDAALRAQAARERGRGDHGARARARRRRGRAAGRDPARQAGGRRARPGGPG